MLQEYSTFVELKRVPVIDVPITGTNMSECVEFLTRHIDELHGEYICVSNAHTSVMAHDDPSYWACQADSLMSVPDGKPLSVVGRKTIESMGRVTGPDLMREIFNISLQQGWSHYFYGNEQKNLDALKNSLQEEYQPGNRWHGAFGFPTALRQREARPSRRIADSDADFAWIALGAPRQEVLMHELKGGPQPLMIGVGGAFNVLAGVVPEAPMWMQNLSLEWLYRLIQEPKRLFKRYLVTNTKFLFYQFTKAKRKEGK